jgi:hypothetical protein
MDSQNDEYFDEETGEVMSPRENNMAAIDTADERITNQNNVDKNGNSALNSVLKSTECDSDHSKESLDVNVNNVDIENGASSVNSSVPDTEADVSPKSMVSSPVDSGRHFRVQKSSQPTGACGDNAQASVTFSPDVCAKGNDFAKSKDTCHGSTPCIDSEGEGAQINPAMDVDHCEQTSPRSPNIIHVSDPYYSEDVLIQYGVDPYKWMYPKDLARPEKPQSPVPSHSDNDLTDSELLTQFCSGKSKGFNSSQSKPRRGTATGPVGHSHMDAAETTPDAMRMAPRNQDACPSQPKKVIITENERFRVPPKLKTGEDSCREKSDKNKRELPLKTDRSPLPGRRAGMIRMESGESETGESKGMNGRKTMEEVELNTNSVAGAASWNLSNEDLHQQYSEYVKNIGDSKDEFVLADDITDDGNLKCTCPQCGHEMYGEVQEKSSLKDREKTQDKENICNCDHSDKGPDWHAMLMFRMFKMHSFMMDRSRYHFPMRNANQAPQIPPFPPPPWVRPPWSWRSAGCPVSQVNQARGPQGPPCAGQGPHCQWSRTPWCKPAGGSGDNSPHGPDKPKDVPEAGAC